MQRKIILILLYLILPLGVISAEPVSTDTQAAYAIGGLEPIKKDDRVLIFAPHPDDEVIGCAGVIQAAVKAGAKVSVVYMTNGDHNQLAFIVYEKRLTFRKGEFIYMGEVRRKEAIQAMKLLGVDEANLVFLGYPDFGTFTIFREYWQAKKPYKGMLTRISSVPYKENLSYGAPYTAGSILADFKRVLTKYRPNKIFVSHPADTNVDHRAAYLFLQIALSDLEKELPRPKIYPYLVHCVGWPLPRRYHPELPLLPPRQFTDSQIAWVKYDLTPEELEKKHQAILCSKSQTESSAFYLFAFARRNELFGDYPEVEFAEPLPVKKAEPSAPQPDFLSKTMSFFGFSNIFVDSGIGAELGSPQKLTEVKGQVSYSVAGNALFVRIEKKEELSSRFGIMLYLFGYSTKTPFAQMPKVFITTRHNRFKVFNARKMIAPVGVESELKPKELILKVPLEILGNPDFVLISVKTFSGITPLDTTSFRKIDIR